MQSCFDNFRQNSSLESRLGSIHRETKSREYGPPKIYGPVPERGLYSRLPYDSSIEDGGLSFQGFYPEFDPTSCKLGAQRISCNSTIPHICVASALVAGDF